MQPAPKNGHAKVLIVDDHAVVREGIAQIIRQAEGLKVCAQADCPDKALEAVSSSQPDVAVLDLSLAARSGVGLIHDLKEGHPHLPILVLSMHDESLYAERVLRAGASGYIMKQEVAEQFVEAPRLRLPYLLGYSSYLAGYDDWKYDGTICSNHVHHAAAEIRIMLPDPEN